MDHHEFGAAVRLLRESTPPESVGLPAGGRRVPGLRREELGELAGMSADYVRRLEQGRSHPSAGVVKAIARALQVRRADYERLCALAGYAAVVGQVPNDLGPGALRLLERFPDTPMFVSDAAMNLRSLSWWTSSAPGAGCSTSRGARRGRWRRTRAPGRSCIRRVIRSRWPGACSPSRATTWPH